MPVGYLITVGIAAFGMFLALVPLGRSGRAGLLTWFVSAVPNESPFLVFAWVLAATLVAVGQGDLAAPAETPLAWAGLAVAGITFLATPIIVRRGLSARGAVDRTLDELASGSGVRSGQTQRLSATCGLPWFRILFAFLPIRPMGLKRTANISYGPAGAHNRLDLYRDRRRHAAGPILIHLHGGHFRTGRKSFEARPLLHRLARHGWICISANYRLLPAAAYPDYVVDAKRVIAWAREHAYEYGADPTLIFIAGSSSGAHIAATAALTANDPRFQSGFEDADTSVAAAIGFYGYYGPVSSGQALASAPSAYTHPGAPPMLIAHGDQDTYVPPDHVRRFVQEVRAGSAAPVLYVELPGGQHSFDLLHSIRFETLIDGVERFADWVCQRASERPRLP